VLPIYRYLEAGSHGADCALVLPWVRGRYGSQATIEQFVVGVDREALFYPKRAPPQGVWCDEFYDLGNATLLARVSFLFGWARQSVAQIADPIRESWVSALFDAYMAYVHSHI